MLQNSLPHCDSATIESSSMARRINVAHFCLILNQCCVCCPLKIVLQHNRPIADMIHRRVRYFLYVPEASLYREYSESGVSPAFKITDVASGDVRKRISALAASGCRTVLVSIPTKKVVG